MAAGMAAPFSSPVGHPKRDQKAMTWQVEATYGESRTEEVEAVVHAFLQENPTLK